MILFKILDLFLFCSGCVFWGMYAIGAIQFVTTGGG